MSTYDFNVFLGTFDLVGTGGGGGGSIGGTIAATQVAFGTGADTIGGSANFTWDGTTLDFTSAHGLSFAGPASPITVVGNTDGSGNTALLLDNADDYLPIRAKLSAADFFTDDGSGWFLYPGSSGMVGGTDGTTLSLQPAENRASSWFLQTYIHSGDTEHNEIHAQMYAQTDSGTDQFESVNQWGATNGTTTKDVFAIGTAGHYTALGVLSDYQFYLYDEVNARAIWTISSTFPDAVQFGSGISISVPGVVTAGNVTLDNAGALRTDTTTAHTGLFQAYDVDNTTYRTFATLTNGNTPTFVITPPSGGTVTVNATTLQQGGNAISLASTFTTSGANALTLTTTGSTNVTLPTSGTLLTTSGSGTSLTFPGTLSIASGKVLTASNTLTFTGTDGSSVAFGTGGTATFTSNNLSVFAATTSAQLAGVISDETGSGLLVFGTAPTLASTVTIGTQGGTTGAALFKGTTSGTVTLSVADAAGTWTMKLPTTAGTNGYSLTTDGSGNTTWTNVSSGSGATTALDNLASVAINASLLPGSSGAIDLGSTAKQWGNVFLKEGGVINWDNGDATITQTGNDITVAGITTFGVGTSTAVTLGTIEVGAASDTTVARLAAGEISVEGRPLPIIIACSGTATSTTTSATETNLANILIPGGMMGTNGMLFISLLYKFTGTNNVKTPFIRHTTASGSTSGGTLVYQNATVSSSLAYKIELTIWNSNSASAQVMAPVLANSFGQSATTTTAGAINTANDSYINLNGTASNNSTDTIGVVGYTVTLYPGV